MRVWKHEDASLGSDEDWPRRFSVPNLHSACLIHASQYISCFGNDALASLVNTVFNLLEETFNVLLWERVSFLLGVDQDPFSAMVILAVLV